LAELAALPLTPVQIDLLAKMNAFNILNLTVPFLPVDPGPLKRLSTMLLSFARGLFNVQKGRKRGVTSGAFSATWSDIDPPVVSP